MADPSIEAAYAAGLFDGEGCVQLYMRKSGKTNGRKDRALRATLSVTNVDLRPLEWLRQRFGGKIVVKIKDRGPNQRPLGLWRVTGYAADDFAEAILPHLIVKREQLELWLEARSLMYRRGYMPGGLPDDEVARRRRLVRAVHDLKGRGERQLG